MNVGLINGFPDKLGKLDDGLKKEKEQVRVSDKWPHTWFCRNEF